MFTIDVTRISVKNNKLSVVMHTVGKPYNIHARDFLVCTFYAGDSLLR